MKKYRVYRKPAGQPLNENTHKVATELAVRNHTQNNLANGDYEVIVESYEQAPSVPITINTAVLALISASVNAAGDELTLNFNKNATAADASGVILHGTGAGASSIQQGNGTSNVVISLSELVYQEQTVTVDVSGFSNGADNVNETGFAVTNNSTQAISTSTKVLKHVLRNGQSQDTGVSTNDRHSQSATTNPRVFMLGSSPVLDYSNADSDLAGDIATIMGYNFATCVENHQENSNDAETGSVILGRELIDIFDAQADGNQYDVLVTISSKPAEPLTDLNKGGNSGCFERGMAAVERAKQLAIDNGYRYELIPVLRHGGSVENNYGDAVQAWLDDTRTDTAPFRDNANVNLYVEQQRQRTTVTPEASQDLARVVSQNIDAFLFGVRYAAEYGGDEVHQTADGQIHTMMYLAACINEVEFGSGEWIPLMPGDAAYSEPNDVKTITIPILGKDGTLSGTGDYTVNIYNETDAVWVDRADYSVTLEDGNSRLVVEFSSMGEGKLLNVWLNYEDDVDTDFNSFKNAFADDTTLGYLKSAWTGRAAGFNPDATAYGGSSLYDDTNPFPLDKYIVRRVYNVTTLNTLPNLQNVYISNTERDSIYVQTSEVLDDTSISATTAFTLSGTIAVGKTLQTVSVDPGDNKVKLTYDSDFDQADTPELDYVKPVSNPIKDLAGNALNSFSGYAVDNQIAGDIPQQYTNYYVGGENFYGFTNWHTGASGTNPIGWMETHPVGFDAGERYACVIDGHGLGFTSSNPDGLDEGAAWFIKQGNDFVSPYSGTKFIVMAIAGGQWINSNQWSDMIEYAFNHPNVDPQKIFISGLSGGAMKLLLLIGDTNYANIVGKLAGAISYAGTIAAGYSVSQIRTVPLLVHHGENDTQRTPGSVAGLRDAVGGSVILNVFQGLVHNGTVWHGAYTDQNESVNLVSVNGVPSDPYKSIWDFFDENSNAPSVPNTINNLAAAGSSQSQIDVTWTNQYDGGSAIIEIELERSPAGANTWSVIASISGTELTASSESYDDTGLSAGTSYDYRIIRTNSIGDSSYSNVATASTQQAGGVADVVWINYEEGDIAAGSKYNNVSRFSGVGNLKDEIGANTGYSLTVVVPADGYLDGLGETGTDGAGTPIHDTDVAGSLLRSTSTEIIHKLGDLPTDGKTITLRILSTYNSGGNPRRTILRVWNTIEGETNGNKTQTIVEARNNYNEADYEVVFADISPNGSGEIWYSFQEDTGGGSNAGVVAGARLITNAAPSLVGLGMMLLMM